MGSGGKDTTGGGQVFNSGGNDVGIAGKDPAGGGEVFADGGEELALRDEVFAAAGEDSAAGGGIAWRGRGNARFLRQLPDFPADELAVAADDDEPAPPESRGRGGDRGTPPRRPRESPKAASWAEIEGLCKVGGVFSVFSGV